MTSPAASAKPRRSAAPLPWLTVCSTSRNGGSARRSSSRSRSRVPSVEQSSTTTISRSRSPGSGALATRTSSSSTVRTSLKAGMTIEMRRTIRLDSIRAGRGCRIGIDRSGAPFYLGGGRAQVPLRRAQGSLHVRTSIASPALRGPRRRGPRGPSRRRHDHRADARLGARRRGATGRRRRDAGRPAGRGGAPRDGLPDAGRARAQGGAGVEHACRPGAGRRRPRRAGAAPPRRAPLRDRGAGTALPRPRARRRPPDSPVHAGRLPPRAPRRPRRRLPGRVGGRDTGGAGRGWRGSRGARLRTVRRLGRGPRGGDHPRPRLPVPPGAGGAARADRVVHLLRHGRRQPALVRVRQRRLGDLEGAPRRPARALERRITPSSSAPSPRGTTRPRRRSGSTTAARPRRRRASRTTTGRTSCCSTTRTTTSRASSTAARAGRWRSAAPGPTRPTPGPSTASATSRSWAATSS